MKNYFKSENLLIPFNKISAVHIKRGEEFHFIDKRTGDGEYLMTEEIENVAVYVNGQSFIVGELNHKRFLSEYESYLGRDINGR